MNDIIDIKTMRAKREQLLLKWTSPHPPGCCCDGCLIYVLTEESNALYELVEDREARIAHLEEALYALAGQCEQFELSGRIPMTRELEAARTLRAGGLPCAGCGHKQHASYCAGSDRHQDCECSARAALEGK